MSDDDVEGLGFGLLFGDEDEVDEGAAASPARAAAADGFPSSPLLRRNISLSQNTQLSLEARLCELKLEDLQLEESTAKQISQLESQIERIKIQHGLAKQRIALELTAVTEGISKAQAKRALLTEAERERHDEETYCGVCLEAPRNALVAPCGHIAMCFGCAVHIRKGKNPICPYCREKVEAVFKAFIV